MKNYNLIIGGVKIPISLEEITDDVPVVVTPPPTIPPVATQGNRVGVNTRPWFPMQLLPAGMPLRCYISSQYMWQPGGLFVQPMAQAYTETTHGFDDFFQRAKTQVRDVVACIHQTPEWYVKTGRNDGGNDYAPCKDGLNRALPAAYKDYAAFLFQVAARYGRVKHPDSVLRVDTTPQYVNQPLNVKRSGLDLLRFMEPWNEEKWWKAPGLEYIRPEEMAALMSACYDGHQGALGSGVGIKTADPSMVVLMPGLTDFDMNYVGKMHAWFVANRPDKRWPCDVLNFHHYSNLGNVAGKHPQTWVAEGGCTPALDKDFISLKDVMSFAKSVSLPVWITECGYDSQGPSQMHIQTDLGAALIATVSAYLAEGVERVFIYDVSDENPNGQPDRLFQHCGLFTSQQDGFKPKPLLAVVADYLKTLPV